MPDLVFVYDETFQRHRTPESHPESPSRLAAIEQKLKETQLLAKIDKAAPRVASADELSTVHNAAYIEELEKAAGKAQQQDGIVPLDEDTFVSAESYDIAKLAV